MSFTNLMHIILKNINAPISWDWQIFGGWWGGRGKKKILMNINAMPHLLIVFYY